MCLLPFSSVFQTMQKVLFFPHLNFCKQLKSSKRKKLVTRYKFDVGSFSKFWAWVGLFKLSKIQRLLPVLEPYQLPDEPMCCLTA